MDQRLVSNTNRDISLRYSLYPAVPTLEDVAVVSLVQKIWTLPGLSKQMDRHFHQFGFREQLSNYKEEDKSFCELEGRIRIALTQILPATLIEKATNVIRPIGLQILRWRNHLKVNYKQLYRSKYLRNMICWTMKGTVDKVRTLGRLLSYRNDNNILDLYIMACNFCCVTYVSFLWKLLPRDVKKSAFFYRKMYKYRQYNMTAYLTHVVTEHFSLPGDETMLDLAIMLGNLSAVKYFWRKLTHRMRSDKIGTFFLRAIRSFPRVVFYDYQVSNEHVDIVFFLLSKMTEATQKRNLHQNSGLILKLLFCTWPYQEHFVQTLRQTLDLLNPPTYCDLIMKMVHEMRRGDRAIVSIFRQLWIESPPHLKESFIPKMKSGASSILWKLLAMDDTETLRLIFKDTKMEDQNQIAYTTIYMQNVDNLYDLIYGGRFHLFLWLLEETKLSADDLLNLKEELSTLNGNMLCQNWILGDNWESVEMLFKWCFETEDDRNNYKHDLLDKTEIFCALVSRGKYGSIDKFMNWCFGRSEEIDESEKSRGGLWDWNLFLEFVESIHDNEYEEHEHLEEELLPDGILEPLMFDIFVFGHHYEFASTLVKWYFKTDEKIKEFKERLILSEHGQQIFATMANNAFLTETHWQYLMELTSWFFPLNKEVILKLKNRLRDKLDHKNISIFNLFNELSKEKIQSNIRVIDSDDDYDITSDDTVEYDSDRPLSPIVNPVELLENFLDSDPNSSDSDEYSYYSDDDERVYWSHLSSVSSSFDDDSDSSNDDGNILEDNQKRKLDSNAYMPNPKR